MELDPFRGMFQNFYNEILMFTGRYDEFIERTQSVLRKLPNHPGLLSDLGRAFNKKGLYDKAFEFRKVAEAKRPDPEVEEAMVQGYEEAGYEGAYSRAAETLVARSRTAYVPPDRVAWYYTAAEQNQKALDWLERGFEERDPSMPYIGALEYWDTLHDEPRYQDLLRRMNFPEEMISRILKENP
jgi:tetratricopeptide (TPR) repeat protein